MPKNITKQTKFIRLPLDDLMMSIIQPIMDENPFFSELDAIRFLIGRQIKETHLKQKKDAGQRLSKFLSNQIIITLTPEEKIKFLEEYSEFVLLPD